MSSTTASHTLIKNLVGLLTEVSQGCTRDDDLPDGLLPRIDAALTAATEYLKQPQGTVPIGPDGHPVDAGFELWWAGYMPQAFSDDAWKAWQAAQPTRPQTTEPPSSTELPGMWDVADFLGGVTDTVQTQGPKSVTHTVKSWSMFYIDILSGDRTSDIRLNDRKYAVGDVMILQEFDPVKFAYTGRQQAVKITYLQQNKSNPCAISREALAEGYVVLSIKLIKEVTREP